MVDDMDAQDFLSHVRCMMAASKKPKRGERPKIWIPSTSSLTDEEIYKLYGSNDVEIVRA